MTHKSIKISIDGFLYLLNRFKTKCYSGECDYEKIPYNTWRELNRYTRGNVRIYLYPTGFIQLDISDDCDNSLITSYAFDTNDKTFGSFLFEEMDWDELDDAITRFDKEYEYKNWYDNYNTSVSNLLTYDLDTSTSIDNTGLATDTTATTSSSCDWYYTTDLSSKVDKSDLAVVQCVVVTYSNGTSWYRIYSDGWCEQGGTTTNSGTSNPAINLIKTYASTNYTVNISFHGDGYREQAPSVNITSSSSFTIFHNANVNSFFWLACGYIEV